MPLEPSRPAGRVVELLNYLAARPEQQFTLSDLARRLSFNKATCQSILLALAEAHYVRRDPATMAYSLGPALVGVGEAARASLRVVDEAARELDALSAELGLESAAAVAAGPDMVIAARAGTSGPFGPVLRVGQIVPLAPPLGTVFMAWAGAGDVDAWLERTRGPLSARELEAFRETLAAVRERGYTVSIEVPSRRRFREAVAELGREPRAELREERDRLLEELVHEEAAVPKLDPAGAYEVVQIAAPVFAPDGTVALALAVYGFPGPLHPDEIQQYAGRLLERTERLTERIHGRAPNG